jgi:hypothetical protein
VDVNLPGDPEYVSGKPKISKRRKDGTMAGDVFIYIDDLRPVNDTEKSCWDACQKAATKVNYLGIQSAPRKRRPPSQEGGAWAGSLVHTTEGMVVVLVSEEKWQKTRDKVRWIREALDKEGGVDRKELERHRGFLVYVSRTYTNMVPFLKGIHLLLDSWREDRNEEGWKFSSSEMRAAMEDGRFTVPESRLPVDLPKKVFAHDAPRVIMDVEALMRLTESPDPPRRVIRSLKTVMIRYGFGDASGAGFGSSILIGTDLVYRTGTWSQTISEESSNYRELRNLVDAIELSTNSGELQGSEVFFFTDNTTAEGAFFKGTSSSKTLYELVVRMKALEQRGEFKLHVIHVAGTRMIAQGTDGLSRGDVSEGVMAGEAMATFVPLHLSALERDPRILDWIKTWVGCPNIKPLQPKDWFDVGHGIVRGTLSESGVWLPVRKTATHIWSPPPSAADVAVEEMLRARHKDPESTHVFVVPKLMTYLWRKRLFKETDIAFEVPVGVHFWDKRMHEKLIVAIVFPLLDVSPWRLKRMPVVLELERKLSGLWEKNCRDSASVLCELRLLSKRVGSMPGDLVRAVLHGTC